MDEGLVSGTENAAGEVTTSQLLAMMPYGEQFRFVDEFQEADRSHIVARFRFKEDRFFYSAHFPDRPVTPGVILLEAMCQCGIVAQGIYLLAAETGVENAKRHRFLLTGCEVEWFKQVRPASTVAMRSELLAWRMLRIRSQVKMFDETGSLLAESLVLGMGVLWGADNPSDDSTGSADRR